jgi:hypothetical protein
MKSVPKSILLFIISTLFSLSVTAQDSQKYIGVYTLEQNPEVMIILKKTDTLYTGMVGTATNHQEIGGVALESALQMQLIGGDDPTPNYIYSTEKDKLQLVDAAFNSLNFVRSSYSVDSVLKTWSAIPSVLMKTEKTDSSGTDNK